MNACSFVFSLGLGPYQEATFAVWEHMTLTAVSIETDSCVITEIFTLYGSDVNSQILYKMVIRSMFTLHVGTEDGLEQNTTRTICRRGCNG